MTAIQTDIQANPQNEKQRKLLDVVIRYRDTYNDEVDRMVLDCYSSDALVSFTGAEVRGHEQFLKVEQAILQAAPQRRMRIDRVLFAGEDTVVAEAVILDGERPDFFSPFCVIMTVRNGRIVEDHSYLDPAQWPGIAAAAPFASPGGLGQRP
ncbi:MAG: nuclear transport factor 2 family protein [Panacagrimonas sp.]